MYSRALWWVIFGGQNIRGSANINFSQFVVYIFVVAVLVVKVASFVFQC